MKGLFSVCILLGLLITSPAQSQELYDDFTGPLLSSQKWFTNRLVGNNISNVLEFGQVITKKKLDMFNHCSGSILDGNSGTTTCSMRLIMQNGSDVTSMEALVQPIALEQNTCSENNIGSTWIRLGGAFFNSSDVAPANQVNDVQAYIALRRNANSTEELNVLHIEGHVLKCTEGTSCATSENVTNLNGLGNPIDLGTITVKKKALLKLVHDPDNNRFVFTQGKGRKAVEKEIVYGEDENFPPYLSNGGYKRLEVRHSLANCSPVTASNWVRAYFDNFYVTKPEK